MTTILQRHVGEDDTIRAALKRLHGITCKIERPSRPVSTNSLTSGGVTLYSYVRKSTGGMLWLIEARFYAPPDIEWCLSWVLDGEPTDEQISTILMEDMDVGATI